MCAETVGPAVALFSGLLMSSLSSYVSYSSLSTVAGYFVVVSGTVGTGDSGSVVFMEVVSGRKPGCWIGKGLGEASGKEQGRV